MDAALDVQGGARRDDGAAICLGRGPGESYGTIEGKLEEITIHGSQAFAIWQVDGTRVRCLFGKHVTLGEVLAGVGKRVAARGAIKVRPTGEPMSVEVEWLRILGPGAVTAADVRGIFRDHEVVNW
jgi:hypothetical protein